MSALVWLLIPVVGAVVAAVWSFWITRRGHRSARPGDQAGVRGYQAFRAAMERAPADG